MFFKKIRHRLSGLKTVEEVFDTYLNAPKSEEDQDEIQLLFFLVQVFRPAKPSQVNAVSIRALLNYLEDHPEARQKFRVYLADLFHGKNIRSILTESGILQNKKFFHELRVRIFAKFVPHQPPKDSLAYILTQVFYANNDSEWVRKIPFKELEELAELVDLQDAYIPYARSKFHHELFSALTLISQRMSGKALDAEVLKMLPNEDFFDGPFETLELNLDALEKRFKADNLIFISKDDEAYIKLLETHKLCEDFVERAYQNSAEFGISITVNQSLLKIKQQLKRFKSLIEFLIFDIDTDSYTRTIDFWKKVFEYHSKKNNIGKLIDESTQIIAYEVTQHTAKTGEHYITSSRKEYFNMLYTAMGGGLIVGILCIIKILMGKVEVSDFGHAFLYSMNYSLGFIAIYLLGFTLATKQPAMTASALVSAIKNGMKSGLSSEQKHLEFAQLFARLFRSQFIAFVGNVLIAFPVSLILIYLIDVLFGANIAASKHEKLMEDISPVHSLAIFHAAIAGVFLFLSGIISGSISNKNKHVDLYHRIEEHPILKEGFGKQRAASIANWFEKKWPGVASNFWFGIFMGSTASIGLFFGLNLDIRHITFASGNLALGMYGSEFQVSNALIFWGIFGIGIIGFINFIVSFTLSLYVAFRSRQIPFSEIKYLFSATFAYFKKNKMEFFFPPKTK